MIGSWLHRPLFLFVLMCVIWGVTWILTKTAVAAVPPLFFAGTRFVAAAALLGAWLIARGQSVVIARADWMRLLAVVTLMGIAAYGLLFWGMTVVASGLSAVLNLSVTPVALMGIAIALGEERFSARHGGAIALGVVGILVLFGHKAAAGASGGFAELWGSVAIVAAALVYCWGSVLMRSLLRRYDHIALSFATMLASGVALMALSLAFEPGAAAASRGQWGLTVWLCWLYLVVFGSLVAFTIYLRLVRDWGASRAGTYAFVSPIIAVLIGVAWGGETVGAAEASGMAIMLAAAWLALRDAPAPTNP